MYTVIFAGGSVEPGERVHTALTEADMIIAADSGAEAALSFGHIPAIIVGDFDSLGIDATELEARGSTLIRAAVEKDETDTELAIQVALDEGATKITLLGATGGARFDHTIANILLLASIDIVPIDMLNGPTRCWLLRGPDRTNITGQSGDLLSLFPLTTDATGITTSNLYYPLHNETLRFSKPRGISNVLTSEQAEIALEQGILLVVHTISSELQERK